MPSETSEILEKAVTMLKKGASIEEAVSRWPEKEQTLRPLLEICSYINDIPKNQAPEPSMQRKYATAPVRSNSWSWVFMHKFAAATLTVILAIVLAGGTAFATLRSLPGQKLFTLKKSSENLRLMLAQSPEAKAKLQISFTKQRISEAEKIFDNPSFGPEVQKTALQELINETNDTIAVVDKAAKNNELSASSYPIVSSLENIEKQQKELIKELVVENGISSEAQNTVSKLTEVKNLIIAANQEETLAKLGVGANTVVISGTINKLAEGSITVEETTFLLTDKTLVKDQESLQDLEMLEELTQVNILGTKDHGKLVAKRIIILEEEKEAEEGEIKGAETEGGSTTTPEMLEPNNEDDELFPTGNGAAAEGEKIFQNSDDLTPKELEKDVKGTFIIEDPKPQAAF